ncbi:MAG TPA: EVE domain-containing protein, partial [Acidobacteriota bacterium]|nr:EVE domain-containing protein [Acidobacteriota bacterium]
MQYWLMKSEPSVYSIDDLKKDKKTAWTGVRNFKARNYMKEMKIGDKVLFYHSNSEPKGVAGIAEVCSEARADPTQFDKKSEYYEPKATTQKPYWYLVDVCFKKKFNQVTTLES